MIFLRSSERHEWHHPETPLSPAVPRTFQAQMGRMYVKRNWPFDIRQAVLFSLWKCLPFLLNVLAHLSREKHLFDRPFTFA